MGVILEFLEDVIVEVALLKTMLALMQRMPSVLEASIDIPPSSRLFGG